MSCNCHILIYCSYIPDYSMLLSQLRAASNHLTAQAFCPGTCTNHLHQAQSFISFCDHYGRSFLYRSCILIDLLHHFSRTMVHVYLVSTPLCVRHMPPPQAAEPPGTSTTQLHSVDTHLISRPHHAYPTPLPPSHHSSHSAIALPPVMRWDHWGQLSRSP